MSVQCVVYVLAVISSHCVLSWQGLGSSCKSNTDCQASNGLICLEKFCVCNGTSVADANGQKCIPKAKNGEVCEAPDQCAYSDFTECHNGRCRCKPNYKYIGEKCTGSLRLDDMCMQDSECLGFSQTIVWCYGRKCSCRRGFTRNGEKCVIGGSCTSDSDCSDVTNSFCDTESDKTYSCKCRSNFTKVADNTACLPISYQIDGECRYNEQCTYRLGKAECKSEQCKCSSGAVWNKNKTMCVIGGNCATDEDCNSTKNSYCYKQSRTWSMCKCKEGFINVANDTKCLPSKSECINNRCNCSSSADFKGDTSPCGVAITVGADCEYDDQCTSVLGKSECINNRCNCSSSADFKGDTSPCGDSASRNAVPITCFLLLSLLKIM